MSKIVIMQPYYFAWYGFFEQIKLADIYVFYDDVQYVKRSLMNRVTIRTKDGDKWMTIPLHKVHQGDLLSDICVKDNMPWRREHLELLEQSYSKTLYFNEMISLAKKVLETESNKLTDITINAIKAVARYYNLNQNTKFYTSSELAIKGKGTNRLFNISKYFDAQKYITGMGALNYFDFEVFDKGGINVEFMDYAKTLYPQKQPQFNPYVAILDLIANTGKTGAEYMNSNTVPYRDFIKTSAAKEYLKRLL